MDHNNSQHQTDTTTQFDGFEPLSANYLYCPNQFFDVCIRNCSRGTVRIVAYMLRQTLGWLDREGNPIRQAIHVTYSDLIRKAGVSRGAIGKAITDAVSDGFIECSQVATQSCKGQAAESAVYSLRWSNRSEYTKSPDLFDGFYSGEGHRTPIPNSFFDRVISTESLAVVKIVGTVLRHTVGYQNQFGGRRQSAPLSYSYIQQYSGLNSRSVLSDALKIALQAGYIHCVEAGRFNARECQRKSARYAVKWRLGDKDDVTGSKTEPAHQFKNRTNPDPKSEPVDRFKNRTKEKTFSKHTDKQAVVATSDKRTMAKMIAAGVDRRTATALLKKRGSAVVENQLAWIDARNPTENRIGMLRKAIDEDWQKPASIELHERQLQQRERERQHDVEQSKEAASIAKVKQERKRRREVLLREWSNASTDDRQRWIQLATDRESSKMITDIIRRDSVAAAKPHTQVLDAIAADRHLPPVQQTASV